MNILKVLSAITMAVLIQSASAKASTERQTQTQIEGSFKSALHYLNSGQPEKSIPVFLSILAQNPNLVRVRLELARAYFNAENWSKARQEFFIVLSADLPEPVKKRVMQYIRAIDSRRGFDWDLDIALVSVGNQRRYDDDTVVINTNGVLVPFTYDRDIVRETGIKASGSFNLREPIQALSTDKANVSAFSSLAFSLTDAKGTRYDDALLNLSAGIRASRKVTTYSFAPAIGARYIAGRKYEHKVGAKGVFERLGLMGGSAFGSVSYYDVTNHIDDTYSGSSASALLGFRRSIGGRAIVGVSAQTERKSVSNTSEDALTSQINLFGTFELGYGITAYPTLYYRFKDIKNPSEVLMANPDQAGFGAKLKLEKSDWFVAGGYTPYIEFSYEDTRSDISAFSYTEGRAYVGLTRRY